MSIEKEEVVVLPRRKVSCTTSFDSLWFCYSPVHQMQQYYRLGSLDNCSGKWNALVDCLKLKTKRSQEAEEILETREKEKTHIWSFRTPEEAASNWNDIFGHLDDGLKINLEKSVLHGVGTNRGEIEDMAQHANLKVSEFPMAYLGFKVGSNMNLYKSWQPVIECFTKRLSKWKGKTLSFGGRVTLIQSVLSSLPNYYFSLFRAPQKVIEALEKIRRRFLWSGGRENRKIHWIAWDQVIAPKEAGGLGIGSLKAANLGLLARWWLRYKQDVSSLWRAVIVSLHDSNNADPHCPIGKNVAGVWKFIHKAGMDIISMGIDIKNSLDNNEIEKLEVSFIRSKIGELSNGDRSKNFQWNNWVSKKVNIMCWRASRERLPLRIELSKRGIVMTSTLCPFCKNYVEDADHLFISCDWANKVWDAISDWCQSTPIFGFSVSDILDFHSFVRCNKVKSKALHAVIMIAIWGIWKARNELVFKTGVASILQIIGEIKALSSLWITSRSKKSIEFFV